MGEAQIVTDRTFICKPERAYVLAKARKKA
jgi:hypothetical protein